MTTPDALETAVAHSLTIPDWLPPAELSTNGRRRSTPWRQRELTAHAKLRVVLAIRQSGWPLNRPAPARARLTVTLVFPVRRRRDTDNLYSRIKVIPDALVAEGILSGDHAEVLDLQVRAVCKPGVTETRLTVEEIQ